MRALQSRRGSRRWRWPEPTHTPLWSLNLPTRVRHLRPPGSQTESQRGLRAVLFVVLVPVALLVVVKLWDAGSLTLGTRCPTRDFYVLATTLFLSLRSSPKSGRSLQVDLVSADFAHPRWGSWAF